MATDKQLTLQKYKDIQKEFDKLGKVKEFGVPKYSNSWVIHKVASRFYLKPFTVEQILKMELQEIEY
jgi:hypothetical protein